MAADDVFAALGEFGLQLGMTLISKAAQPSRKIDKTALANAVLDSSIEKASIIFKELGLVRHLDDKEDAFGFIVGVISQEMTGVIEALTDMKISIFSDSTRDIEQACGRAFRALQM